VGGANTVTDLSATTWDSLRRLGGLDDAVELLIEAAEWEEETGAFFLLTPRPRCLRR
jgi:hypothetical protein